MKMLCTLTSTRRVGAGIIKSWRRQGEGYDLKWERRKYRPHVLESRDLNSYLYLILSGTLGLGLHLSRRHLSEKGEFYNSPYPTGLLRATYKYSINYS